MRYIESLKLIDSLLRAMKVNVNSKEIELDKSMTIAEIIIKLGIKSVGIAVALNYEIVSKKDYEYLEKDKSKIKALFEELDTLSLRERDDVESGGCIIETEGGIINARLEDRWKTLEGAFEALGRV